MERVLRRPSDDRIIGGVCSGLGRYFDIDPTLVRLAWLLFTIAGGSGILAYVLAWLVIPDESGERSAAAVALVVLLFLVLPLCGLCFGVSLMGVIGN